MSNCTALAFPLRTCTKCHVTYPATLTYFYKHKGGLFGLASTCKWCNRSESLHWHFEHSEHRKAYLRSRPRKEPTVSKKRCPKCGEIKASIEFNRAARRPDGLNSICKPCQSKNRRHYYLKNREKELKQNERWYSDNPDKGKEYAARRRARLLDVGGDFTIEDVQVIGERQGWRCWWCQKNCKEDYHIDHRIPVSRGGRNGPGNLVISCPYCNQSKKDKMPFEWSGRLL